MAPLPPECSHLQEDDNRFYHRSTKGRLCCHCYEKWVKDHFRIPQLTLDSIQRWVDHGTYPGGFLTQVLYNSPASVVLRFADEDNRRVIDKIYHHLINKCPHECWGNKAKVERWAYLHQKKDDEDNE